MKLTGPVTFIYINKYSKTEILPFCYWHNKPVIGLCVIQFRGNWARNFKLVSRVKLLVDCSLNCTPLSPVTITNSASNPSEIKMKKIYKFKHNPNPSPIPLALGHLYSLCTNIPPPSGKIGRGDVCESPMIIVFLFPRNVGDSLWLVVMLMPWCK